MSTQIKQRDIQLVPFDTTGTSTAYLLQRPRQNAYINKQIFWVMFNVVNGASPTLNMNGLGAKALVDSNGVAITASQFATDRAYEIMYLSAGGGSFKVLSYIAGWVTPTGIEFDITPTTGNKITFSVGTGADTIAESNIVINPATGNIVDLIVEGDQTVEGNLEVQQDLDVAWDTYLSWNLDVDWNTVLDGDLAVTGNTVVETLEVNGESTFNDNIEVVDSQIVLTWNSSIEGGQINNAILNNPSITWGIAVSKLETFQVGESIGITIGQHMSKSFYEEKQIIVSSDIKTFVTPWSWSNVVNYWEAFNRPVSSPIKYIIPNIRLSTASESWGSSQVFTYSLQVKIYDIIGSLWTTAINTWTALLTSTNTISWTLNFNNTIENPQFNFDELTTLPAWQYAFKIEGILTASSPWVSAWVLRVKWDAAGWYIGNAIDWAVADAWVDMWFNVRSISNLAVVSDATNADKTAYIGVATETKNIWEDIIAKTRWPIAKVGALGNEAVFYLSNTPWEISTSPWTNDSIVWRWVWVDVVNIRWLSDVSLEKLIYNSVSIGTTDPIFLSWGGLVWFTINSRTWDNKTVILEKSTDWINWISITETTQPFSSAFIHSSRQVTIEKNNFVRFRYTTSSGGSANISYFFIPF